MGTLRGDPTTERNKRFQYPTPDAYSFFLNIGPLGNLDKLYFKGGNPWWTQVMEHETYDSFWKDRSIYHNLKNIKPAVLVVGGWYDAEDLLGTIQTYYHIEKQNPGIQNTFVMGPWTHGSWGRTGRSKLGAIDFKASTGEYFQESIQLPFFNYYLKGKGTLNIPEAAIFETGANAWRFYDEWPPKKAFDKSIYLQADGKLAFDKPESSPTDYDEYISDPKNPVPYTSQTASRLRTNYFVEDQRFAARRPDVLVYQTDVLTEDITITGPITVDIHVSTSGTDSDWIVKVIDVLPDSTSDPEGLPPGVHMGGYQMMVRGDVIRGKFRNSFENPEPFEPNQVTRVKFELPDVQHRFLKGHKIMAQIQSSWFPLIDMNPQTFCHVRKADEEDFQKAVQRIYRSKAYPSNIQFLIIE
jgi:putative CocE/NonD family hydrolase